MAEGKKRIFISYSHKDAEVAQVVRNQLLSSTEMEIWMDRHVLVPGQSIAEGIEQGITGSDYYLLLISENSKASSWVQREIAMAFELAQKKLISVVPLLIEKAEVPFEFRGLLYIDASKDFARGMTELIRYFVAQRTKVGKLDQRWIIRKSGDDREIIQRRCQEKLRELELGDLRYEMADRLSIDDVAVLWFDIFNRQMRDETNDRTLALTCATMIDRSRLEALIPVLIDMICRNHPRFASSL